jgi:peptide deformylase
MSLLPITLYGDKILRKKVDKVKKVDNETIELIKNMFDTMRNAKGIGIAANQVGVNKSIFVVDVSQVEGYENIKPLVFINPKITNYSEEKTTYEEGCLSIPEIRSEIYRPNKIKIVFQDIDLKEQTIEADELLARVVQHEFDHLQGVLFIDLIDKEKKKEIKENLESIKNRKVETEYPVSDHVDYQLVL